MGCFPWWRFTLPPPSLSVSGVSSRPQPRDYPRLRLVDPRRRTCVCGSTRPHLVEEYTPEEHHLTSYFISQSLLGHVPVPCHTNPLTQQRVGRKEENGRECYPSNVLTSSSTLTNRLTLVRPYKPGAQLPARLLVTDSPKSLSRLQ